MGRFYKYTIIKPHPLQENRWMVWIPILPFVPPFYGTKAECEKARKIAETSVVHVVLPDPSISGSVTADV